MNGIMVTARKRVKGSGRGKGGMAHIHKDMVQTRVHSNTIAVDLMKSVVGRSSTCKGSIRKRSKHRKQMGPGLVRLRRRSRDPIMDRIRIGVPVSNQKVIGGEKISGSGKLVEKTTAGRAVSVGIDVGNFVDLPLEAKS
jgi:hypothetical protein